MARFIILTISRVTVRTISRFRFWIMQSRHQQLLQTLKAREPSKLARPIMIRPPKLPWGDGDTNIVGDQAEHVGLYHFGSACVSPTAMVLPDALIRHPRFFPTAHTIGYEVVRTLDKKNYKALWHPVQKKLE